jgi:hypothetical protein
VEKVGTAIREHKVSGSVIPEHLLVLLVSCFNLSVEGNTDVLHRCVGFAEWNSESSNDAWFGAKGYPFLFKGYNTYCNLLGGSENFVTKILSLISSSMDSEEPTRVVIIGQWDLFEKYCHDKRVVQLASVEANDLGKFSILLTWNKASMIFDPISWSSVTFELRAWAETWQYKLQIPDLTVSLFQERSLPTHQCRIRPTQTFPQVHVYSFFEPMSQFHGVQRMMHPNLPPRSASLLAKINRFDRTLLVLGILPNQLRSLAIEHKMEHIEDSLMILCDALFWEGYEIWMKRKSLVQNFWVNIAPEEWKVKKKKESKSRSKRKLRPNCQNPFHFCERILLLSNQRRTVCACSDIRNRKHSDSNGVMDIRYFLTRYPNRISISSSSPFSSRRGAMRPSKIVKALVRDDLIRKEHDRGKKKKNWLRRPSSDH